MPSRTRRPAAAEKEEGDDITVDDAPTSINPYDILGLETTATAAQITSAYRKAALKSHPDKAAADEKDAAHAKFQEVAFAYTILSDERRRKRYDTTGRTEESLDIDGDEDFSWADFFRNQYRDVVTADRIEEFKTSYQGGEEEKEHVLEAYERCQGDIVKIFDLVMVSDMLEDEERFRTIIDAAIEAGDVEDYAKYSKETEKKRKARIASAKKRRAKEEKEAEAAKEEIEEQKGGAVSKPQKKKKMAGGDFDLGAEIARRQEARGVQSAAFFEGLEAKYGDKGGKRTAMDEPPEEAFAANRKWGKEDAAAGASSSRRSKRSKT